MFFFGRCLRIYLFVFLFKKSTFTKIFKGGVWITFLKPKTPSRAFFCFSIYSAGVAGTSGAGASGAGAAIGASGAGSGAVTGSAGVGSTGVVFISSAIFVFLI